jgi:hypothetical protein
MNGYFCKHLYPCFHSPFVGANAHVNARLREEIPLVRTWLEFRSPGSHFAWTDPQREMDVHQNCILVLQILPTDHLADIPLVNDRKPRTARVRTTRACHLRIHNPSGTRGSSEFIPYSCASPITSKQAHKVG